MSYYNRGNLRAIVLIILMLFSSVLILLIPTTSAENDARTSHTHVEQFGEGFDETIIATASSQLDVPRDLEFHPNPARANELWVLNRATDSITIISNAGLSGQSSQNKHDAYGYHFMEESSAIAFGSYHSEFDYQFASAQESRNTYDGQAAADNFMGPALWPSSLSHFAAVNQQQGGPLGSHLDMLHESPNGMGIAHDSGNAYWYNDGYYEELVYYDFQDDHDTGGEYHEDGMVRRYTEITPTRSANIPGHMILDKVNGILYISDTGAGRVLWVNTDDQSTTNTNIYSSPTRMEVLAEYREITDVEWGVLATGLSSPSGIALHGDTLFVSQNGNGKISAYELASNGKSGTHMQTVDTNANSIMGLEVGPDDKLWYVDAGLNRVVRIDPFDDADGDSVKDEDDNCPLIPNVGQDDHDSDNEGDLCDVDDDGDSVPDSSENCQFGELGWTSNTDSDHDGDGCRDASEDDDDDEDGVSDGSDDCERGMLGWLSGSTTDHDGDGCQDEGEDLDDDDDHICDTSVSDGGCVLAWSGFDRCPKGATGWISSTMNDADHDGCLDATEDDDDDDDGFTDFNDWCPNSSGTATQGIQVGCPDFDGDGWADLEDEYQTEPTQWKDSDGDGWGDNTTGVEGDDCPLEHGTSTTDLVGCPDTDEDTYSDQGDAFPSDATQWNDSDADGYGDNWADSAWDGERVPLGIGIKFPDSTTPDACPSIAGNSTLDRFGCLDSDSDGWSDEGDSYSMDATQWSDLDGDGYGDNSSGSEADDCSGIYGTSTLDLLGCIDADGDGWSTQGDAFPNNADAWSDEDGDGWADQNGTDISDDCPLVSGNSTIDRNGCMD
nr:thrombospondin type 3 repeat-containing protein [Candidatus Poseidoniales archaeon]